MCSSNWRTERTTCAPPEISAAGERARSESHRRRSTFTRRWHIVFHVYKIKQELEDLCLRYLDPEGYQNLIVKVGVKRAEREENIRTVIDTLSDKLKEMNIHYEIDGKLKHFTAYTARWCSQHEAV